MSHFEELDPDQRIVLRMAVRRRRSYAAMAEALGATPDEIRSRALGALNALAPERPSGLSDDERERISDYLLGQQDGTAREHTARLLGPTGPARSWALLVEERLASLGEPVEPVPAETAAPAAAVSRSRRLRADAAPQPSAQQASEATPAGGGPEDGRPRSQRDAGPADAARTAGARRTPRGPAGRPPASDAGGRRKDRGTALAGAAGTVRRALGTGRRRALVGGAAVAVVLVLVVLVATGAFGGGDDGGSDAVLPEATQNQALAVQFAAAMPQTIPFRVPAGAPAEYANASGVARPSVSTDDVSVPVLALETKGLPAVSETRRYFVWADRNGSDPVFLGELPDVSGAQLPFQGVDVRTRQAVIVDPTIYSRVRVTVETSASPTGPGRTVLVGTITPPERD